MCWNSCVRNRCKRWCSPPPLLFNDCGTVSPHPVFAPPHHVSYLLNVVSRCSIQPVSEAGWLWRSLRGPLMNTHTHTHITVSFHACGHKCSFHPQLWPENAFWASTYIYTTLMLPNSHLSPLSLTIQLYNSCHPRAGYWRVCLFTTVQSALGCPEGLRPKWHLYSALLLHFLK